MRPSPRALLRCCAALLALASCAPADRAPERPPRLVLVLIDTLRADMLSSYGNACDPSPALSALSADGVQFDSVLSQTSWTLPSVGSLLTSRYPRSLGLYDERSVLPEEHRTLAEILSDAGWATFGATANPNLNRRAGMAQGFDEYVDSIVVFKPHEDLVTEDRLFYRLGVPLQSANDVFAKALDYADRVPADAPAYVQLNVMEVHEHAYRTMLRPEYAEGFEDCVNVGYLRKVRQVTDDLAAFVGALRARPGWEDALFCVTSDHGEGLGDHPDVPESRGHGALLYDSQVKVPWLMFRAGWMPARHRIAQDVRLLDMTPTLLDAVGVAAPGDLEGVSLMPLVEGRVERAALPAVMVTETTFRDFWKLSARGDGWVYVHNRDGHPGVNEHELQPIGGPADGRLTDLADRHADEVQRLSAYLADWEHAHAPAAPTRADLSEAERQQLEQIGYLR